MRLLAKLDRPTLARVRHAAKPWPNRLLRLTLVVLAAAGILHFSGARTWPLELVHHFVPQYGLVAVGVAAASLLLQRRRQSAAAMLLAGCFGLVHWTGRCRTPLTSRRPRRHLERPEPSRLPQNQPRGLR
jgi:hypothetical protein